MREMVKRFRERAGGRDPLPAAHPEPSPGSSPDAEHRVTDPTAPQRVLIQVVVDHDLCVGAGICIATHRRCSLWRLGAVRLSATASTRWLRSMPPSFCPMSAIHLVCWMTATVAGGSSPLRASHPRRAGVRRRRAALQPCAVQRAGQRHANTCSRSVAARRPGRGAAEQQRRGGRSARGDGQAGAIHADHPASRREVRTVLGTAAPACSWSMPVRRRGRAIGAAPAADCRPTRRPRFGLRSAGWPRSPRPS